jgi:hypothetical protein
MDGVVEALDSTGCGPEENDVPAELPAQPALARCKLLMTHMSRSPTHLLAAPSDARCTRSDRSAFRESLAGRRHFG